MRAASVSSVLHNCFEASTDIATDHPLRRHDRSAIAHLSPTLFSDLSFAGTNSINVKDLKSTNGTAVNGRGVGRGGAR